MTAMQRRNIDGCSQIAVDCAGRRSRSFFSSAALTRRVASFAHRILSLAMFPVQAAFAVLVHLQSAADRTIAEGAQLRVAVAAAAACDDHDALTIAPRIAHLCAAMRDQLCGLWKDVAVAAGPDGWGCVSVLRLMDDTKAATLSKLAQLGGITQQRSRFSEGPLQHLGSRLLLPTSEATLLQFFGGIPVSADPAVAHLWSGTGGRPADSVPLWSCRGSLSRCSLCPPSR